MTRKQDCFCYVLLQEEGESKMRPAFVRFQTEARVITPEGESKTVDPSSLGEYSLDAKGDWQRGVIKHLCSLNSQMRALLNVDIPKQDPRSILRVIEKMNYLVLMLIDLFEE